MPSLLPTAAVFATLLAARGAQTWASSFRGSALLRFLSSREKRRSWKQAGGRGGGGSHSVWLGKLAGSPPCGGLPTSVHKPTRSCCGSAATVALQAAWRGSKGAREARGCLAGEWGGRWVPFAFSLLLVLLAAPPAWSLISSSPLSLSFEVASFLWGALLLLLLLLLWVGRVAGCVRLPHRPGEGGSQVRHTHIHTHNSLPVPVRRVGANHCCWLVLLLFF